MKRMTGADDLIISSTQGVLIADWVSTIKNIDHDDPTNELVFGLNHSGTVYILSPFGNKVFGYNPNGTHNNSLGEEDERPGISTYLKIYLRSPNKINGSSRMFTLWICLLRPELISANLHN